MKMDLSPSCAGFYFKNALILACVALLQIYPSASFSFPPQFPELKDIREEISLLNLLRGLYLSKDQVQKLSELAQKTHDLGTKIEEKIATEKKTIVTTFGNLRDSLFETPGYEKDAQKKAGELEHRIKEEVGGAKDKVVDLEGEARNVLSQSQVAIVEDFSPCLIPPRDFANPVRVGQAGAESGILCKVADLIRVTPDDIWKERGSRVLEKITEKVEADSGKMNDAMKDDFLKRLSENAEAIRSCKDVDYTLNRSKFASDFLLINHKQTAHQGHKDPGKIAQFFLSDAALRVYPKWLKSMDKMPPESGTVSIDEPGPGDESVNELAARAMTQLRPLYNRRKAASLPEWTNFIAPLQDAARANDKQKLFAGALGCLDQLLATKSGPDLVKAYVALCRFAAQATGVPVAAPTPDRDVYGFGKEIRENAENPDHQQACQSLKKIIAIFLRFKKA